MKDITILFSLANPISEKILVHKLFVKMFLSNHIARFFDHQFLWKESIYNSDFLHGGNYQGKVDSETTAFGLVWLVLPLILASFASHPIRLPDSSIISLSGKNQWVT